MSLHVLVVDDERPALDELAFLLGRDPRVGAVRATDNAAEALRVLQEEPVDAVFTDIRMPGLTGLDAVGLGNVDGRLRNAFGDDYGLVVETARGAGTRVVVRVPKFAPGVHAQ